MAHDASREPNLPELQPTPTFTLVIGNQSRNYTYQQAFAIGHSLVKANKFDVAAAVFEKLATVTDRGPRAHILLSICRAGLSDYKQSRDVLDRVFQGELAMLAPALHEVIVEARMGFKNEALRDLLELVNKHKELPTLCLWLGDLFEKNGQPAKAVQCWQLAIKRDRPGGAVALAAYQQLKRVEKEKQTARDVS